MPLGKLQAPDYTKLYDPKDLAKNKPTNLQNAREELSTNFQAFQFFGKCQDTVWKGSTNVDAAFLIGVERDFMEAVPPNASYKAFGKQGHEQLGFVLVNPGTKNISLYDVGTTEVRVQFGGVWYENVGDHNGKTVFARLDRPAIQGLHAGSHLTDQQLGVYETSMRKGVIASGSTGSDGIKFDHSEWVIKITISMASAHGMDNTLSPMATVATAGSNIYLNFNQLTKRH